MSACLARVEQHSLVGAGHDARRRLGARVDPESAAALAPVREALLGNRDHLVRQRALVQAEPGPERGAELPGHAQQLLRLPAPEPHRVTLLIEAPQQGEFLERGLTALQRLEYAAGDPCCLCDIAVRALTQGQDLRPPFAQTRLHL